MAEILYFLETTKGSVEDLGPLRGIVGDRVSQMAMPAQLAPRRKPGVLVWRCQETELAARHVLDLKRMIWGAWSEERGILAGVWRDWVPGPDDLEREGSLGGIPVVLADGREWRVPRLMLRTGRSGLPMAVGVVDGQAVERPSARYEHLQRLALECLELAGRISNGLEVDARRVVEVAVEGLGVNYRLGGGDVLLLELLTAGTAVDVLMGMVDVDVREKKKEWGNARPGS